MDKISISKIWGVLLPYSMFLSVLYLMGLWGNFEINIFSFMTPNQLLMSTLFALMATIIASVAGFLFGQGLASAHNDLEKVKPRVSRGLDWTLNASIYFFALVSLFFFPYVFPFFLGMIVVTRFARNEKSHQLLYWLKKNFKGYAAIVFMIVTMMPFISYTRGSVEGVFIKEGYIVTPVGENNCEKSLIGKAGDFVFIYEFKTESVGVLALDELKNMNLFPKKKWECNRESFWRQLPFLD